MTQFQNKRFSVSMGGGDYGDNWERTFGPRVKCERCKREVPRSTTIEYAVTYAVGDPDPGLRQCVRCPEEPK